MKEAPRPPRRPNPLICWDGKPIRYAFLRIDFVTTQLWDRGGTGRPVSSMTVDATVGKLDKTWEMIQGGSCEATTRKSGRVVLHIEGLTFPLGGDRG